MPKSAATLFEIWALSWIYGETIKTRLTEPRRLTTNVWVYRYPFLSAENAAENIPIELAEAVKTEEKIIRLLVKMREKGLLENNDAYPDCASRFFLTPNGTLFLKRFYQKEVIPFIQSDSYEKRVQEQKGDSKTKGFFKQLGRRLRDKTQDEIVDSITYSVKEYGKVGFAFLLSLIGGGG